MDSRALGPVCHALCEPLFQGHSHSNEMLTPAPAALETETDQRPSGAPCVGHAHTESPGQLYWRVLLPFSFYRQAMGAEQRRDLPQVTKPSIRPNLQPIVRSAVYTGEGSRVASLAQPPSHVQRSREMEPRPGPSPAWTARIAPEDISRADVVASALAYPCPPRHSGSSWLLLAPPSSREDCCLHLLSTTGPCLRHGLQATLAEGLWGWRALVGPPSELSAEAPALLFLLSSQGARRQHLSGRGRFLFGRRAARWLGPGPSALAGPPNGLSLSARLPRGRASAPHTCSSSLLLYEVYLPEGL